MSNILILGNGCRESCIAEKISLSEEVKNVFFFPGSDMFFSNKISKVFIPEGGIPEFCKKNKVDYVFPGGEKWLCEGITDTLQTIGIPTFGPNLEASRLESCKIFGKGVMKTFDIQTPTYRIFQTLQLAKEHIYDNIEKKFVIKNPNLDRGKGVYLPVNTLQATEILDHLIKVKKCKSVIIEERIIGEEVSLMGFCNGKEIFLAPQSRDYKKIFDGECGPNTGGLGAVSPVFVLSELELEMVKEKLDKVVNHFNYKGVLYAGIMKAEDKIYFLEFNCRLGDPETQVILNLLKTDLFEVVQKCVSGKDLQLEWLDKKCLTVVLSHQSYPHSRKETPFKVSLGSLDSKIKIYPGNLTVWEGEFYSTGGRILNLTYVSDSHYENFTKIYDNCKRLSYEGIYYRKDIGLELFHSTKKLKIGILASGNGTSCGKLFESDNLVSSVEVIISNKSDSGVLTKAKEKGLTNIFLGQKVSETREEYGVKLTNILKIFDVDLIILAGWMKILDSTFIREWKDKIINIHPSLLPKYEGLMDMNVHKKVIQNGDKISGCTFHYVTEEVDKGEVILQKQYHLQENETSKSLRTKIQSLESTGLLQAIDIFKNRKINYKLSGVDIEEGENVVQLIKSHSKEMNRTIGGFSSVFQLGEVKLAACTDGVGSKLDLAIELKKYDTIGIDLVAMIVNDLYCSGAKPLFFLDYLATDKVISSKCGEIIRGVLEGCDKAECKLVGGETAEMKSLYFSNKFDLAGFGVGVVKTEFPKKTSVGNKIYGLRSSGVHSNGFSLVRKLLKFSDYSKEELLTPTKIYSEIPGIIEEFSQNLLAICHVTGGGINENLPRVLSSNLHFQLIDWEFPKVFQWIQKETEMTREEMLSVFNCGFGMLLVFDHEIKDSRFQYLGEVIKK